MKPYLLSLLLLIVFVSLQGAWPAWLRMGEQPPSLVIAAVVCIGLIRGAMEGCLAGLIAAVLYSGAAHLPMGGLFTGLMVVGGCAGFLRSTLLAERIEVAVLVCAIGVIIAEFLRLIFAPPPEFLVWLRGVLFSALFTAIISPVPFWLAQFARTREPSTWRAAS